ncbi:MAG: hypothetical protein IRZ07_19155 [Microbispora sp.]|nr:hypothetical protein [Microbispora sp.]
MSCRRGGGTHLTGRIAGLLLAGTSASAAFITGVAPLGAAADNGHGQGDRAPRAAATPQGKDPRVRSGNKLSVTEHTNNRGYQHTSTNTAGGSSNVQNALCRRSRVCNITQHVTVVGPRETVSPSPVPTVTVTVTVTPTPSLTAPRSAPAEWMPCLVPPPLIMVDGGLDGQGVGLIHGLLSLSVLVSGTACPGTSG